MATDNTSATPTLSENTALRLLHSVTGSNSLAGAHKSASSLQSNGENEQLCRICRWDRSDTDVVRCPCHCKGTVGFIHMQCLKRWILHRRDLHCEICNGSFVLPEDKVDVGRMLKNFCNQCAGPIAKHSLYGFSLLPLSQVVLQQVFLCMENINQSSNDQLSVAEILIASCVLVTSSALFFHIFEFITTRLLTVRYILRQWWSFGSATEFPIIEVDSDMLDFF